MPRFKDQAICIRLIDWSESSQVVALLCEHRGKLRGLAKGSKRTSPGAVARYSGGIELLTLGQVVAVVKPSTDLATLTEWDLQESYWHLRRNLRAQRLGLYAADLATAMLADHDPHPNAFGALAQLLTDLATPNQQEQALLQYQWRLLTDCGYQPQLDRDVATGKPLDAEPTPPPAQQQTYYVFDPHSGGLTTDTNNLMANAWRVRPATVQMLRRLATGEPIQLDPTLESDSESIQTILRANRLLCVYARSILDRQLPTMEHVLEPPA